MTRRIGWSRRLAGAIVSLLLVAAAGGCGRTTLDSGRVLPPPAAQRASPRMAPALVATPPETSVTTLPTSTSEQAPATVDLSGASAPAPTPAPTGISIPAIDVQAPVVPLGENADGTAQVPSGFTFAGWYDLGPRPGQLGPAVILGHVDSTTGPAVFFRLRSLEPGDTVTVDDGPTPVSFRVQRVVTYAKDAFPTVEVFGPTPDAELRLVTCGGPFDRSIGHYEDNIVVYATVT